MQNTKIILAIQTSMNLLFKSWMQRKHGDTEKQISYNNRWRSSYQGRGGWDIINRFHSAIFLCLSQTRTWITNVIFHGLFFVFRELRWEVIVRFVNNFERKYNAQWCWQNIMKTIQQFLRICLKERNISCNICSGLKY